MEVKSISYNTMSKPSFGMAILKPERIVDFERDIFGKKKNVDKISKGLSQIVKRASKNRHYDVSYRPEHSGKPSSFEVLPRGEFLPVATFPVGATEYPTRTARLLKSLDEVEKTTKNPIKQAFYVAKFFVQAVGERIRKNYINQEDYLPAALRKAVDTAEEYKKKAVSVETRQRKVSEAIKSAFGK